MKCKRGNLWKNTNPPWSTWVHPWSSCSEASQKETWHGEGLMSKLHNDWSPVALYHLPNSKHEQNFRIFHLIYEPSFKAKASLQHYMHSNLQKVSGKRGTWSISACLVVPKKPENKNQQAAKNYTLFGDFLQPLSQGLTLEHQCLLTLSTLCMKQTVFNRGTQTQL